jgi:hypothetical protein
VLNCFAIILSSCQIILRIENIICEHTGCELNDAGLNDIETDGRPSLQYGHLSLQHDIILEQNTLHSKFGVAYRPPKSISSFVAGFKSVVTINARIIHADFGWQTRFHDHIIHTDPEYKRIAYYIENNPANWEEDKYFGVGSA